MTNPIRQLRTLPGAAALFIATWVAHTSDHARRGIDAASDGVTWAGTFAALLACVAITLVFARHTIAPTVAAVVFPSIAIGVSATHLLPEWGLLSDPILVESKSDNWTVAAVFPEIIAAGWLGWVAFDVIRRNGFATHIEPERWSDDEAIRSTVTSTAH